MKTRGLLQIPPPEWAKKTGAFYLANPMLAHTGPLTFIKRIVLQWVLLRLVTALLVASNEDHDQIAD